MHRLFASNWHVVGEDETGSMVDINFRCNQCAYETGVLIFTSQTDLGSFETDVTCPICGADLTVICVWDTKI